MLSPPFLCMYIHMCIMCMSFSLSLKRGRFS
jgi:hypothetical protein